MPSITIKGGTKIEVPRGFVSAEGQSAALYEFPKKTQRAVLVVAYCMNPGETVRRVGESEDYIVDF